MKTYFQRVCVLLPALGIAAAGLCQQFLLLERTGSPRTEKLSVGQMLEYRTQAAPDEWLSGQIVLLRPDQQLIGIDNYYLALKDITELRQSRFWARAAGVSLTTFGLAWSGLALVGTATDGIPDTKYQASDAIVTLSAVGLGVLVNKLFGHRRVQLLNGRFRLRIVDVTF